MAKVVVIGGSGLIGGAALPLLSAGGETRALLRRAVPPVTGVTQHVLPADEWAHAVAELAPDVLVSTLGTTIAQAGSQAAFRAIDHDLVLAVARAARAGGATRCITVSSVGASGTGASFYLRTKGEVEAALSALGFARLDIIRPGLLTGSRSGPARPAEALAVAAAPLTDRLLYGSMRRYRSIPAVTVARAIATLASRDAPGRFVHEHDAIVALAAELAD